MNDFSIEQITSQNLFEVVSFIRKGEAFCVSLMNFFVIGQNIELPKVTGCFRCIYRIDNFGQKSIFGVFAISSTGRLTYYMPYAKDFLEKSTVEQQRLYRNLSALLKPLLIANPIACIVGEAFGARFFSEVYPSDFLCWRKYILMEYDADSAEAKINAGIPDGLILRKCDADDTEVLYPLQKEYEIVEVLTPGDVHNSLNCKAGLRYALKNQRIFGLFNGSEPVAKAGTNAIGFAYDQIGGVFTVESCRNRGLAQCLVRYVTADIRSYGKNAVLFVKVENESAKKAYANAGFKPIGLYAIVYYV